MLLASDKATFIKGYSFRLTDLHFRLL